MGIILVIISIILICFAGVLIVGAPYLPTLSPQVTLSLDMSELKAGQRLIELGSGDGKVVLAAAKRGIHVTGYELNPILVIISRMRTLKYRKNVKIIWGNFWTADWPKTDAIFVFLLPKHMKKLDTKCMQYSYLPVKLISFAFEMPKKKIIKKSKGVFIYRYN